MYYRTLDYIFVSEHWKVNKHATTVYPKLNTSVSIEDIANANADDVESGKIKAYKKALMVHGQHEVEIHLPSESGEEDAIRREEKGIVSSSVADVFAQELQFAQPSLQWPSDHFLVFATLTL